MAKTVIILGAGASRHAGAPLMNEFLERARDLAGSSDLGAGEKSEFELVHKAVNKLQLAHSKGDLDIWNLEAVFDAFEMAELCGSLGDLPTEEIKRLPEAMRQLIVTTLQAAVEFRVTLGKPEPTEGYQRFVNMLKSAWDAHREYPAVITFNYDVCLDFALDRARRPFDYCLEPAATDHTIKLLKLHGSINWGQCQACGSIFPVAWDTLHRIANEAAMSAQEDKRGTCCLEVERAAVRAVACNCKAPKPIVMLVPPTVNKGRYHDALSRVWSAAAGELRTAEQVFVCGYSLPDSDLFFRYLYAVGSIGEASLRRVWVFDPDPAVKPRFERLLGQQVLAQPGRFQVFRHRFETVPWEEVLKGNARALARSAG